MAFTNTSLAMIKLAPGVDRSPHYDDIGSALAAGISSLTSLGTTDAVARACCAFLDVYRLHPATAGSLSVAAIVSIAASSTTSLLTLQFQIIPAV